MDAKSTEVSVGAHRISVTVFGSGEPAVVIEPAFGGSAQSWHAIAGTLGEQALTVPMLMALPRSMRNGADRRSTVREFRSIKALTAADQSLTAGALGGKPLVVLTHGAGSSAVVPEDWRRWHGLHAELARLSANSRHVIASQSGHYIHKSEPGLVTTSIRDVLHSVRTGTPLAGTAPGWSS